MRMQGVMFSKEECDWLWSLQDKPVFTDLQSATNNGRTVWPERLPTGWITSNAYDPETGVVTPNISHQLRTECWIDIANVVDEYTTMKDIMLSNLPWIKDDFDLGGSKLIKMVQGDFLHNHVDSGDTYTLARRQWTMIIQLSEPDEYTGGDFHLGDYILPKDRGFCCLFDGGTQLHEVKKIISGTRKSWITWMPKESLTFL